MSDIYAGHLVAEEVKARLFSSLAPVWSAALMAAQKRSDVDADRMLLVVQLAPAVVRVVKPAEAERPAENLASCRFAELGDGGRGLAAACRDFLAAVLSGLDLDGAGRALRFAEAVHGEGGFVVVVQPELGLSSVILARPGESLASAVRLGSIVPIGETLH